MAGWLIFSFAVPALAEDWPARGGAPVDDGRVLVEAELLADTASAAVDGTFRLGVLMRIEPGWHIYWKNSGDAGFPTEVEWISDDASFGPLQFPAPEVFLESGGLAKTFGYTDEVLLFSVATPAAAVPALRVRAETRFLVCKVRCLPGEIRLELDAPTAGLTPEEVSRTRKVFDHHAARLPVSAAAAGVAIEPSYSRDAIGSGDAFELKIGVRPCSDERAGCTSANAALRAAFATSPGEFAADVPGSLDLDVATSSVDPADREAPVLILRGRVLTGQTPPAEIRGVLGLLLDGRPRAVSVAIPFPAAGHSASAPPSGEPGPGTGPTRVGDLSLWLALGLGLVGGLILNLMPCVLPILALKAFRIVEAGGAGRRSFRSEAYAYALGVLVSMAGLAGVVIGLRTIGVSVGWGFQFQEPLYLASLATLLTAFALNLFGVYEIHVPTGLVGSLGLQSQASARSFFDGVLAVLLATPCSAPFLGTAVGFALAAPALTVIAVFLAIGVGLASPYLAVSLIPGLAARLPRPGAWVDDLRSLLGFALLATVVWLLWIAGPSVGVEGTAMILGFLLLVSLGCWVFGKFEDAAGPKATGWVASSLVLATLIGIALLPLEPATGQQISTRGGIRQWNAEAVRRTVEAGQPVFVDFTADWCLTCKANERLVLSTAEVEAEMKRRGIVRFRGDWTLRDEAIRVELARHGRAGVPLYLGYRPGQTEDPEVLPELLTVARVIATLRRLAPQEPHSHN